MLFFYYMFFFFQAEDGIRDIGVTGVQTCALPIFDYELPEDLIAQSPAEPRDASRLMVVDVGRNTITHHTFRDLPDFLRPGDALILNETKVIPARVEARKPTGGAIELLFLKELGPDLDGAWEVLARPSKRLRPGLTLFAGGERLRLVKSLGNGHWAVSGPDLPGLLRRSGRIGRKSVV